MGAVASESIEHSTMSGEDEVLERRESGEGDHIPKYLRCIIRTPFLLNSNHSQTFK